MKYKSKYLVRVNYESRCDFNQFLDIPYVTQHSILSSFNNSLLNINKYIFTILVLLTQHKAAIAHGNGFRMMGTLQTQLLSEINMIKGNHGMHSLSPRVPGPEPINERCYIMGCPQQFLLILLWDAL